MGLRSRNSVFAVMCALSAACVFSSALAQSQSYPIKRIRLVVGVPPGGTTDSVARLVGQKLAEQLRQAVLIDNRGGAGGNIGADLVAKSAPDGYTLLLGTIGMLTINPSLYARMPFDTMRDFSPISQLTSMPQVLTLHPSIPARTTKEFIAFAKARPGSLNFASGGVGNAGHLAGELFNAMAHVRLVHVPYKGSAPALTDLLGGQVALMFEQILTVLPHHQSGRLRGIAVTTEHRSPVARDIPTIAESGVPGYSISTWHGLLAPAGTPKEIVSRLNAEVSKALKSAEIVDKFRAQGVDAVSSTPEQFSAFIKSELEKWSRVVKATGAQAN